MSEFSNRAGRVTAALAAVAVAAACSSNDGAAPAATVTTKETTVPISAISTAVVDAGAEPRQRVQLRPAPGAEQRAVMTTRSDIYQQIADQPQQDLSTPAVTMPLTAVVTGPADPALTVDLTLGELSSPDVVLQDALASSAGSEAGLTVQPSGAVTALRITPDADSRDIARSAIEQAFYQAVYRGVTFPDAEIGVGAVWTMRQQVMSGMVLNQVTTATLRARDGDRLTVDLSVTQTPESPVWDLPGDTGTLSIDTFTMAGTGTLVIDLAAPLPVDGSVTLSGEQTYTDPNSTTRLRQATTNSVRWSRP
ncbi:hypothetical protein ACFWPA_11900 [Rhodococcus sp. NPDC058505]|uniref:hypothetical protein n=1 Tax=unclassified Rhodococcus (in: high G+C Gram-positive bacteria) TaxID=192944 RepID=UPI0036461D61